MKDINYKHSIIFFNFCILISPIYLVFNNELIIYCLFTRVLVRSAMLRSVGEKNESHERERFFEKSDQET